MEVRAQKAVSTPIPNAPDRPQLVASREIPCCVEFFPSLRSPSGCMRYARDGLNYHLAGLLAEHVQPGLAGGFLRKTDISGWEAVSTLVLFLLALIYMAISRSNRYIAIHYICLLDQPSCSWLHAVLQMGDAALLRWSRPPMAARDSAQPSCTVSAGVIYHHDPRHRLVLPAGPA